MYKILHIPTSTYMYLNSSKLGRKYAWYSRDKAEKILLRIVRGQQPECRRFLEDNGLYLRLPLALEEIKNQFTVVETKDNSS